MALAPFSQEYENNHEKRTSNQLSKLVVEYNLNPIIIKRVTINTVSCVSKFYRLDFK